MPPAGPRPLTGTEWIAIFRGIAIVLVVVGHTARGLDHAHIWHWTGGFFDRWIFAFTMPALFFAAGLFANLLLQHGPRAFIESRFRKVLWPYLIWTGFYFWALFLAGEIRAQGSSFDWESAFTKATEICWLLLALFAINMLYVLAAIPNWGRRAFWWMSVGLWAIEPFIDPNVLPMMHPIMKYAIYFAQGDWIAWRTADGDRPPDDCRIFALISFGLMTILVALGRSGEDGWWALPLALAGIQGLWELSVALDRSGQNRVLRFLGERWIEIYVTHFVAIEAVRRGLVAVGVTWSFGHWVLGSAAGIAGPPALWWVCRRAKFPYLFVARDSVAGHLDRKPATESRATHSAP
ncbi:MAG: acyltransferase family protein [Gemmataceae bacterium]